MIITSLFDLLTDPDLLTALIQTSYAVLDHAPIQSDLATFTWHLTH